MHFDLLRIARDQFQACKHSMISGWNARYSSPSSSSHPNILYHIWNERIAIKDVPYFLKVSRVSSLCFHQRKHGNKMRSWSLRCTNSRMVAPLRPDKCYIQYNVRRAIIINIMHSHECVMCSAWMHIVQFSVRQGVWIIHESLGIIYSSLLQIRSGVFVDGRQATREWGGKHWQTIRYILLMLSRVLLMPSSNQTSTLKPNPQPRARQEWRTTLRGHFFPLFDLGVKIKSYFPCCILHRPPGSGRRAN